MKEIIVALVIVFSAGIPISGQKESWLDKVSSIIVAKSKRNDVENALGMPKVEHIAKFGDSERVYYQLDRGRLEVSYSAGPCVVPDGYFLPEGVVVAFYFRASKPLKMAGLKLNLTGFEKKRESDTSNWIYTDAKQGLRYAVFKDRLLSEMSAGLSLAERARYSCSNQTSP